MTEQKVSCRKTVLIRKDIGAITGGKTWNQRIDIPFTPDQVTVKQVAYKYNAETILYSLYTTLVNDHVCSFMDGNNITPNTTYKLYDQVNSSYTFQVDGALGTANSTAQGIIIIALEFVKF